MDFSAIATEPFDLLCFSGGFIAIMQDKKEVGLTHFSVEKFMLSDRIKSLPMSDFHADHACAKHYSAEACVTYLMMRDFASGQCRNDKQLQSRTSKYRFMEYASCYWMKHYNCLEEVDTDILDPELIQFLTIESYRQNMLAWRQIQEAFSLYEMARPSVTKILRTFSPFYLVALQGVVGLMRHLVSIGFEINSPEEGTFYMYPLPAAAFQREPNWAFVGDMISMGADIYVSCWSGNVAHTNAILGSPRTGSSSESLFSRALVLKNGFGIIITRICLKQS